VLLRLPCLALSSVFALAKLLPVSRGDNVHRPHRALFSASPLRPHSQPITGPVRLGRLDVQRGDRLGRHPARVRTRHLTRVDGILGIHSVTQVALNLLMDPG
jgi:hypothetical protein